MIRSLEEEPDFFQVWIEAVPKGSSERWGKKKKEKKSELTGGERVKEPTASAALEGDRKAVEIWH